VGRDAVHYSLRASLRSAGTLGADRRLLIAEDAVEAGAKVLWLQEDIENEEARRIAEEGGLVYVEDRCMRKTHEGIQKS
jgi:predicted CoA-binding protein